ncbi:dual adapter for phosphotyrosine and 3-phosphotyrosine and 3-phosphoinositide [Anaeramoeba flamelloides]|uniref:Dual adapter for phosphotyrosine and 3-phosphotyrosine and 3-phosphoinositide n=1 Tax=Anaeramoeba flamelloides TaxID=1746091 RepID=A0AAV7Y3J3_9EUKA|nr:dual adapter for phosphotyrosine and 3-phosphotyrosine and 3-phosphoinositide [Anaeramoeba flamelloides]
MDEFEKLDPVSCTQEIVSPNKTLYRYHHSQKKNGFNYHGSTIVFKQDKSPSTIEVWHKNWRIALVPAFQGHPKPKVDSKEIIRYCGYVEKKGAKRKSVKKRWFVLNDNKLSYKKAPTGKANLGEILLGDIQTLEQIPSKRVMYIKTQQRTYELFFESELHLYFWFEALEAVRQLRTLVDKNTTVVEKFLSSNDPIEMLKKLIYGSYFTKEDFRILRNSTKKGLFLYFLSTEGSEELLLTMLNNEYSLLETGEYKSINSEGYRDHLKKWTNTELIFTFLDSLQPSIIQLDLSLTKKWFDNFQKISDSDSMSALLTRDNRLTEHTKLRKSRQMILELENENKDQKKKITKLIDQSEKNQIIATQEIRKEKESTEKIQKKFEKLKLEMKENETSIKNKKKKYKELKKKFQKTLIETENKISQINEEHEKKNGNENENGNGKQNEDHKSKYEQIFSELSKKNLLIKNIQNDLKMLNDEKDDLIKKNQENKKQLKIFEEQVTEKNEKNSKLKDQKKKISQELSEKNTLLEKEKERASGLQQILDDSNSEKNEIIEKLKNEIENQKLINKDFEKKLELSQNKNDNENVNNNLNKEQIISNENQEKKIIKLKEKVKTIKKKLEKKRKKKKSLKNILNLNEKKFLELQIIINGLNKVVKEKDNTSNDDDDDRKENFKIEFAKINERNIILEKEVEEKSKEIEEKSKEVEEKETIIEKKEKEIEEKLKEIQEKSKEIEEKTKKVEKESKENEEKSKEIEERSKEIKEKSKEIEEKTKKVEKKSKENGEKLKQITLFQRTIDDNNDQIKELNENKILIETQLNEKNEIIKKLEIDFEKKKNKKKKWKDLAIKSEKKIKNLQNEKKKKKNEKIDEEEKHTNNTMENENIKVKETNKVKSGEEMGNNNEKEEKEGENKEKEVEDFKEKREEKEKDKLVNINIKLDNNAILELLKTNFKIFNSIFKDNQRIKINNNWFIVVDKESTEIINIIKLIYLFLYQNKLKKKNLTFLELFTKIPIKSNESVILYIKQLQFGEISEINKILVQDLILIEKLLIEYHSLSWFNKLNDEDGGNETLEEIIKILAKLEKYKFNPFLKSEMFLNETWYQELEPKKEMKKDKIEKIKTIVANILNHFEKMSKRENYQEKIGKENKDKKLGKLMREELLPTIEKSLNVGFKIKKTFGQNHCLILFDLISNSKIKNPSIVQQKLQSNLKFINNNKQKIGKEDSKKWIALMRWGLNEQELHLYFSEIAQNINLGVKFLESDESEYKEKLINVSNALQPLSDWKFKTPINYKLKKK